MSGIASMVRKAAARVRAADRRQVLVACAACALAIIVLLLLSEGLLDHDIWRSADRDAFYPLGHYNTTPHMAATVATHLATLKTNAKRYERKKAEELEPLNDMCSDEIMAINAIREKIRCLR